MTGFPHSLFNKKELVFDFRMVDALFAFKAMLGKSFPETQEQKDNLIEATIGSTYFDLKVNLFTLVYVQRMDKILNQKLALKGNQKDRNSSVEALFNKETLTQAFYSQIKQNNPKLEEQNQEAMQNFFRESENDKLLVKPTFLTIQNNQVHFQEETFNEIQAKILKSYFEKI